MNSKRFFLLCIIICIIALLLAACDKLPFEVTIKDKPEKEATAQSQPSTAAEPANPSVDKPSSPTVQVAIPIVQNAPPTPTAFVYQGEQPSGGFGGVYGRMLWNGKPVMGLEVKLCQEIKYFGGCEGEEYANITKADGSYAILNVPPRAYGLTYKALDSDSWYYVTSGILDAKNFEIPANQMVNVGDHHTIRTDLNILTPQEDERLSVARPSLSWAPYPEAAYYELTFHSGRGGSLIHRKQMTETSFMLDRDLQSCDYSFDIEAFNAQEQVIAEYDGWRRFDVGGQPVSCKMVALSPADGATVSASALTLTWEPHAWAKTYKLYMYLKSDSKQTILDFVETREASYKVTQNVPAGEYYWVVYAYDEFGDGLGFTDGLDVFVTNP